MSRPLVSFAVATTLLVDLLVLWGLTIGDYPGAANLFPAMAAGFLTLMAALIVAGALPAGRDDGERGPFRAAALWWLGGLLAVLVLFGLRFGLPLFAVAYALAAGARRGPALALGVGVSLVVELLFHGVLAMPLDRGWLLEALLP
ncbi:hypothetical protein [Azospirillum sp. ST 5-10]|uniref:hypothetical protein n=1 Tax=unclassified Azospirillum TaxID=2630922 RepID=UPI003F4A5465